MSIMQLDDNVSIKTVKVFYEDLKNGLEADDEIILDFSDLDRVDLSVIQVLLAAWRKAKNAGKIIKFKAVNDEIKRQFWLCGLIK